MTSSSKLVWLVPELLLCRLVGCKNPYTLLVFRFVAGLYLAGNDLSGTIPSELSLLTDLCKFLLVVMNILVDCNVLLFARIRIFRYVVSRPK